MCMYEMLGVNPAIIKLWFDVHKLWKFKALYAKGKM